MHVEGGCRFLHPCWHMRTFCVRGSLPPWSFIHMRLALSPSQALYRAQCPSPLTSPPATPPPKSAVPPQYPETGQQVGSSWRAAPGIHRSRGANPPRKPQPPAYRAGASLQSSSEALKLLFSCLFCRLAEFSPGPRFRRVAGRHAASGGRMLPWDMLQSVQ